jgi:uncharacterized membrane protein YbhN (UPF0104 family)
MTTRAPQEQRSGAAALRWLAFGVAAFVFARVLAGADPVSALAAIRAIGPLVALVALPYLLVIGLDALAWRFLFAIVGRDLGWPRLFAVRLSTEAILLSMPGGAILAEGLKPWLLAKTAAVPLAETTATLAAKKVLLIGTQAIYLAGAALLGWEILAAISASAFGPVLGGIGLGVVVLATAVALGAVALVLAYGLLVGSLSARLHALLVRMPSAKLRAFFEVRRAGFARADAHLVSVFGAHPGKLAASALPFLGSWLAETLESFVILRLLSGASGTRPLGFVEVMAFEAVVSLLRSIVFFVPAGLGVQDAGYLLALRGMGAEDPDALGAAFVLLKRAKEVFWIAIGYVVLGVLRSGPVIARSAREEDARRDGETSTR